MISAEEVRRIASGTGLPLYRAVADALARAIQEGRLRPGDRLPTQRALAWDLGVTVSTVTEAYREAQRRRLIAGEVGRGTYVLAESREAELFALRGSGAARAGETIDLSTNTPADLAGEAVARHLDRIPEEERRRASLYPGEADIRRSRAAIVRLEEARGLTLRVAEAIPCAGAQQALTVALLGLTLRAKDVLCEELTAPGVKAAARSLGLRLHPVALDGQGVCPDALARAARTTGASIVVLVPALQNPTGALMGAERRRAVAQTIRREGLTLVEDDVYGPLVEEPPLSGEVWDRAVLVSSLSKSVAAGLRFGWLTGGHPALAVIARDIHLTAWTVAPLAAMLAVSLVESGAAAELARLQREEIAVRRRLAAKALGRAALPAAPAPHLWLPVAVDPEEATRRAASAGVGVVAGDVFSVRRQATGHVRLCLTAPRTRAVLAEALERLAGAGLTAQA
jgi:DNA-binding transcriptional MocR family regulator